MRLRKRQSTRFRGWFLFVIALIIIIVIAGYFFMKNRQSEQPSNTNRQSTTQNTQSPITTSNPLYNKTLYRDDARQVKIVADEYTKNGRQADAALLNKIATQPGTTWLVGPSAGDPTAQRDIETVSRTSQEASQLGTVPVYQLYAIPNRDACAAHSRGGFVNNSAYLAWIDRILQALKTEAVFSIEADAIAHTLNPGCLNSSQTADRYQLLSEASAKLHASPKVLAAYLDAGHSDWWPDPAVLVDPLKKSGVDHVRGVAVNVSFFEETSKITTWAQNLVSKLGAEKGVIIDTSRNGKGIAPVSGERRWCNPAGRGIGPVPSTSASATSIDAYVWIKNIGESDGACGGYPSAGVFVPSIAIELAKNAGTN